MKRTICVLLTIFMLGLGTVAYAQSVAINNDGSSADASAMLDVSSTTKGFLAPRMASLPDPSSLPDGLIIYKNDGLEAEMGYYYTKNQAWIKFGSSSDATQWITTGSDIYYNSGNVGIGSTTPGHKLTLAGTGTSTTGVMGIDVSGTGNGDGGFVWASSAIATGLAVNSNVIHMIGRGESANNAGYIGFNFVESGSDANFLTFGLYSSDNLLNLTGAGRVGIGTTTPRYKLEVGPESEYDIGSEYADTYMRFSVNTSAGTAPESATDGNGLHDASIFAQGSIMTGQHFKAISDERVKKDIIGVSGSIETLQQLHPVTYKMKDQVKYGQKTHYGFIAQEVEKVLPEAVSTGIGEIPVLKPFDEVTFEEGVEYTLIVKNANDTKEFTYTTAGPKPDGEILVKSKTVNDFKSLTYDMIFTLAVDAIQEQQQVIESQQKTLDQQQKLIESQQKAFDEQQKQIDKLEKIVKKKLKKL